MLKPFLTKYFLPLFLTFSLLGSAYANQSDSVQLSAHEFKDQWGQPAKLDNSVKWLIFSHHKDGNLWVRETLNELEIKNLSERHWLYVADISGMPSLITKIFALPKMKKYAFPIALSYDEANTAGWPEQVDTVSVYKLDNLKVIGYKTFPDKAALEDFLMSIDD